jgi:NTE family protein
LRPLYRTVRWVRLLWLALSLGSVSAEGADLATPQRPKTCLVLSGGGARGIAHIGVLKVLEDLHVPIDCVVGTSAGAIIGGAYASGASPSDIETMIRHADWDLLLSDQPLRENRSAYTKEVEREHLLSAEIGTRLRGVTLPRGLIAGQHLQYFLQRMVSPRRGGDFDHLPIPYRALATDFENGRLVVLDNGDLAAAMRASMSVPGAFAPVEIDGHVLVDGGLVRNVGVDVARAMGADRLIVVNLGTPLMKRVEIDSLVNSAEQMLRIFANQNVEASLASLAPDDVLIEPELGTLSVADFAHGYEWIPAAETATRRHARELAAYAVDTETYARWKAHQSVARSEPLPARIEVDTRTLARVPAATIDALVGAHPTDVDQTVGELLATDDFETVKGQVRNDDNGTTLVLEPVEKPWGPDYLRAGVQLTTDFAGDNAFLVTVDHRATWLNRAGLEWRNRASFGRINAFRSQLRMPLDASRTWFVAPELESTERLRDVYANGDDAARYRLRTDDVALWLGRNLGTLGELTVGIERGRDSARLAIGSAIVPPHTATLGSLRSHLTVDRLDNLDFPTRGYLVTSDLRLASAALGSDERFRRWSTEASTALGSHNASILLTARYETSLGSALPLSQAYTLGGFQNLSGLGDAQVLANEIAFVRAVYRTRFLNGNVLLPDLYAGLSLEGAQINHPYDSTQARHLVGGSVFVSAESALGPLYLGSGAASGGHGAIYLTVGRPWP